jgi:hypothetical protein
VVVARQFDVACVRDVGRQVTTVIHVDFGVVIGLQPPRTGAVEDEADGALRVGSGE